MEDFEGKMAVVTGGGTGMGRELVCQLVAQGAHVAMCDISTENMEETEKIANPPSGVRSLFGRGTGISSLHDAGLSG